ncbi:hypothetical protein [Nitrospirillum iridis]|uniref:Uncharacterized protein n=1 Tax=Nitrospirillum iridis TaxID=765888 RepID=A0A7X0EEP1_9PROT|nr:hypothetical protein [Nitrospirillum iridis]MBB6252256.1 hypothetical protein [Nitrospirillum iridis]
MVIHARDLSAIDIRKRLLALSRSQTLGQRLLHRDGDHAPGVAGIDEPSPDVPEGVAPPSPSVT